MKRPKNHSADFKARVALQAIRREITLGELSKIYGVHANQISTWKRAAIEHMSTVLTLKPSSRFSAADVACEPCIVALIACVVVAQP